MKPEESKVEYITANNFDLDIYEFDEYYRSPRMAQLQSTVYRMHALEGMTFRAIEAELKINKQTALNYYRDFVKRLMTKNKASIEAMLNDELAKLSQLEAAWQEEAMVNMNERAAEILIAISKQRARLLGFGNKHDKDIDPTTITVHYVEEWRNPSFNKELPSGNSDLSNNVEGETY